MIKPLYLLIFSIFINYNVLAFDHDYKIWNKILIDNVKENSFSSSVNYSSIKSSPKQFNQFINTLESLNKSEFDSFSKKQKLAFLINAYNAFTVKLIVDNYPVKSIKDLGSFFSSPWKKRFFRLFGKKTYLDKIEHKMIRKWFNEPRIHFAVVCASIGCPALKARAYTAELLESQLQVSANKFLKDLTRNRYNNKNKKLELSAIFKWYGDDFKSKYGSFQKFIANKITDDKLLIQKIKNNELSISYLDYNWNLNEYSKK